MEAIREFGAVVWQEFYEWRRRYLARQKAALRGEKYEEKTTDDPLLGDYDVTATSSSAENVGNSSEKGEKPKARISVTRNHRLIAWICSFVYLTVIYMIVFYAFYYLADQTIVIKDKLAGTLANTYGILAETYADMKNPGSTDEVAGLMTEFYELLAEMGYYELEKIDRPPHTNPGINRTYAVELSFSSKAIEMIEKLPYLNNDHEFWWTHGGADAEFLLFGTFIDLRVDENLKYIEDPLYALVLQQGQGPHGFDVDGGRYMRPDYVCLSVLGNHGSTMILNAKNFKLWTVDQEMGTADPVLKDVQAKGDDRNYNSLDNYPSRPASLALRDYMQKFIDLEWMPGGLYNGSWDGDNYARLYRENGWPATFNRTAFLLAREQWEKSDRVRLDVEEPFNEVEKYQGWLDSTLRIIDLKQKAISDVDAGKEIPNDQPDQPDRFADRAKYRQELVAEVNEATARLPRLQQELEVASEVLKSVDLAVKKAREDRIAKYGW